MSHIFDALQRSEAENAGADLPGLLEATELLKRAERRATSQWESETPVERIDPAAVLPRDLRFALRADDAPVSVQASVEAEQIESGDHADAFGRFQSIEVSVASRNRLVSLTDPDSSAAEAFRLVGVRLRHLRRDRTLKKLLITSTIPQEGKSMVSANLACTLALAAKQRVLLIEGDVRRPSLTTMFSLQGRPGLCEWLQGERRPMTSIYRLEGPGFWILPAGSAPGNPLEFLQSKRLASLMDQLAGMFDWVIIDSPPVLPLADTSVWSRMADGIMLVARQGTTEKKQLQRGIDAIERKKLIGALLNSSKTAGDSDYYYRATPISRPAEVPAE